MSAPAGGGVGVVMAGEGDRLDGEEGACEEGDGDDGGEGSGVLRLTVSRLGSAGVGFAGFGSSFTSGFTSASGSLEVEAIGDRAGEEASRCLTASKPGGSPDGPSWGDPDGVALGVGLRLWGCDGGREVGWDGAREAGQECGFWDAVAAAGLWAGRPAARGAGAGGLAIRSRIRSRCALVGRRRGAAAARFSGVLSKVQAQWGHGCSAQITHLPSSP